MLNQLECFKFFSRFFIEKLSVPNRWLINKIFLFQPDLSLTTTIIRENLALVLNKLVPDLLLSFFVSNL